MDFIKAVLGFIKALLLLTAIPIVGLLFSSMFLSSNASRVDASPFQLIQFASIVSGALAVLMLISFAVFAGIAGKNRTKIASIFPPLVRVTLFVLAILVLVQGAILTYGAYLFESLATDRVHVILIAGIGITALAGAFALLDAGSKLASKQSTIVLGTRLDLSKHPKLAALIDNIATSLKARKPDYVVAGLEPNFYVTSAEVHVNGEKEGLVGETLYLSLPLARILTIEELTAIIGHELGHFRGEDTFYTLKFAPVYSGLSHALAAMSSDKDQRKADSLLSLPAFAVLSYIINVFHKNVSTVSREREFEADKAASEVADSKALASSLLKISLYANAWSTLEKDIVERMRLGKLTRNISQLFFSLVKYNVNEQSIPEALESIAEQKISHPTDSHPTTANRIAALGLELSDIDIQDLLLPDTSCVSLFEVPTQLEETLTILQQRYYQGLGVEIPVENKGNIGATIFAAFGAAMVVADGKVEPEEVEQAEGIGRAITSDFDYIEFREYCYHPESIPTTEKLLEVSENFAPDVKSLIYRYLNRIAGADNDMSEEEEQLLFQIQVAFRLSPEQMSDA